jgi:hypothetical protein
MELSIIIVNYNTKKYLKKLLSSLYSSPPLSSFEVLVVENGSTDDSYLMVKKHFPQVRVIKNCINVGFARANNQAVARAKGKYVLLLNPDILPTHKAINRMINFIKTHPDAGCVGGRLLYPNRKHQLSCRSFPTYLTIFFGRVSLFTQLFPKNRFSKKFLRLDMNYNKTQKVDWIMGACILMKKEVFQKLGGFDEDFFLYVEDLDLCYRLKKILNLNVYYLQDAIFIHFHEVSTKKLWLQSLIQHHFSLYRFFKKHYPSFKYLLKYLGCILLGYKLFFTIFYQILVRTLSLPSEPHFNLLRKRP